MKHFIGANRCKNKKNYTDQMQVNKRNLSVILLQSVDIQIFHCFMYDYIIIVYIQLSKCFGETRKTKGCAGNFNLSIF